MSSLRLRRTQVSLGGKEQQEGQRVNKALIESITVKMMVTFKLLDQRTFELEVGAEEGVEDLICRMEDRLGGENLYRLIYAGKMMREGEMLSEYARP